MIIDTAGNSWNKKMFCIHLSTWVESRVHLVFLFYMKLLEVIVMEMEIEMEG